jgi:hypothetical protein
MLQGYPARKESKKKQLRYFVYNKEFVDEIKDLALTSRRYSFFRKRYSMGWDGCHNMLKQNDGIDFNNCKLGLFDEEFIRIDRESYIDAEQYSFSIMCYSKGYDDCAAFLIDEFGIPTMQANSYAGYSKYETTWRQMLDFIGIEYCQLRFRSIS